MGVIRGLCALLGDNVSTDEIIPGQYVRRANPDELGQYAFRGHGVDLSGKTIIVAGMHFGMGSSREQATSVLQSAGIEVVIAESFGRIFYRNCITRGLPVLTGRVEAEEGDELEIDLETGVVNNISRGTKNSILAPDGPPEEILGSGGLVEHIRRNR